jgi:hypothetical protein
MARPDYEDSVAGDENDSSADYVYLIGDSTGSLTASGGSDRDTLLGALQESDNGTRKSNEGTQEGDDGTP